MAEHTPTPWAIDADYPNCVRITDSHGHDVEIAECSLLSWDGSEMTSGPDAADEANATFIVKACNSHDALVKALTEIAYPVRAMQDRLQPGETLDGVTANALANNADYLRAIALKALSVASHDSNRGDAQS